MDEKEHSYYIGSYLAASLKISLLPKSSEKHPMRCISRKRRVSKGCDIKRLWREQLVTSRVSPPAEDEYHCESIFFTRERCRKRDTAVLFGARAIKTSRSLTFSSSSLHPVTISCLLIFLFPPPLSAKASFESRRVLFRELGIAV